jgi:glucose-6-phosphate 1-dehydrogenase
MTIPHSDAFVFFGATGDLALKKIFPALQAMVKRGHLKVPVIGVARSAKNVDELMARVRASVEQHGGFDPAAFDKLSSLLHYVQGDYSDPATYQALRQALGGATHPFFIWLFRRPPSQRSSSSLGNGAVATVRASSSKNLSGAMALLPGNSTGSC